MITQSYIYGIQLSRSHIYAEFMVDQVPIVILVGRGVILRNISGDSTIMTTIEQDSKLINLLIGESIINSILDLSDMSDITGDSSIVNNIFGISEV